MRPGRRRIWQGEKLERLRIDYEADREPLKALRSKHGICKSRMSYFARLHGWKPRYGKWAPSPEPMPPLLAYIERASRGDQTQA